MSSTPPEPESSPSGTPPPSTPAPAPPVDNHQAPTSPDAGSWSVHVGEVFDRGGGGLYTVKERLGYGGMGEVYRAEHVNPDAKGVVQVFALKVMRPSADPRPERTFIDEVRILSLLRHHFIARYHDSFVDKGRQMLVMEYVDGCSLRTILEWVRRTGRPLSEATSLELLAPVAEALNYAEVAKDDAGHPLNIVHRDVSPSNIMVSGDGYPMLMDFGVAKFDLPDRTPTGSGSARIRGKPGYVSPEHVLNQPADGRADLFSLGCVLVEMLTGEPPFGRSDLALEFIPKVTPAWVDHITRGLSKKVRAICQKALARDPAQRFTDGHEMATAMLANHSCRGPAAILEELSALEKASDAPPTATARVKTDLRRLKKWMRRVLVATCVLAVAILGGFLLRSGSESKPPAVKVEEGKLTVKEMKPEAAPPAIEEAAPAAPTEGSVLKKVANCGVVVVLTAGMMACAHTIHTRTKAGDCTTDKELQHDFEGTPIPDVMHVQLAPSNPKGKCEGKDCKSGDFTFVCDEPCPVYDNGEIIMRLTGNRNANDTLPEGFENLWFGPDDLRPGALTIRKPALLIGKTKILNAKGKYKGEFGHGPRELSGRMTALVTKIQTWDGKEVPVCGVLYGNDGKEGVPIFEAPYFDKRTGGDWGNAYVKFFWPDEKK